MVVVNKIDEFICVYVIIVEVIVDGYFSFRFSTSLEFIVVFDVVYFCFVCVFIFMNNCFSFFSFVDT